MITNVKPFRVRLVAMPSADRGKYTLNKVYVVRAIWDGVDDDGNGCLDFLIPDDTGNYGWVNGHKLQEAKWTPTRLLNKLIRRE